jgi:hypothetical protein
MDEEEVVALVGCNGLILEDYRDVRDVELRCITVNPANPLEENKFGTGDVPGPGRSTGIIHLDVNEVVLPREHGGWDG